MKLRNLFYLLLAMPLAFAACEETPEPTPGPGPGPDDKEPVLTLTSEATLNFGAEGGEGVIAYTLENEVEGTEVTATCNADWVTNITVAENIKFNVAVNEGPARDTKVKVAYGAKNFEVAVKQAAAQEQPTPDDTVRWESPALFGEYLGDQYSPGVGNYYIVLSDNGFTADGYLQPNSTYYIVDSFAAMYDGDEDWVTIPAGEYTFDASNSCAEGTFTAEYSQYAKSNDTEIIANEGYTAGKMTVTENGITLEVTLTNGEKHVVTYEGQPVLPNRAPKPATDLEVTLDVCYAIYYGDQYTPGTADNFYFFISNKGLDADGYEQGGGVYYRFDIYTEIIDTTNGVTMPYGTYTWDSTSANTPGTIAEYYCKYYELSADGSAYVDQQYPIGGSVTVDENGVKATMEFENGATHTINYAGEVYIYNMSGDGGNEGGGDDGGDDGGETGEGYSTLTEDVEINLTNATYALEYYGEYYNSNDNWVLYIYEDAVNYDGAYIMLDFLCDPYADNVAGTYTASLDYDMYTYIPGYVDDYGDMYGSWYCELAGGEMAGPIASIVDGTITIEYGAGEVYTLTFDCNDGAGHAITGTIVANPFESYAYAAPRAREIKAAPVANVTKSRGEVYTSLKGNVSMR